MQQFIQSIFLVIGTAVITNFFTRKIYLSDKDRDIVLKQYEIYSKLYLHIVRNQLSEYIEKSEAKYNVNMLLKELLDHDSLHDYLNPVLYELLIYVKDKTITDSDLGDIRYQIEMDLENIKFKLGLPCKNKYKNHLMQCGIILIVLIYIMISLIFWRLKYPEQFTEQISVIIIAIFIILVFSIYYIGCVFIQNFIYFKKYYFFFKQRKALPQKDIGDKKNYNNYKKQSN